MAPNKTPAPKKPEKNEIAGAVSDIFRDYLGNTLTNQDKTLRAKGGSLGLGLYEDLLQDPHVAAVMQTRRLAVVGKEWEVIPASDDTKDQEIAEFVTQALKNCSIDAARHVLLTGIITGFKVSEIMWEYRDGSVQIKEIIGRSPRRFVFDLQNNLRMLTLANLVEGTPLPERKFVVFRNTAVNGSPYGDALGASIWWPVWFKKNAVKFWMIFSEKYGSPTAVGKYPTGASPEDQNKLYNVVEAIQQESAIIMPDTLMVELLEASRSGSNDTYERLASFMNSEISKAILGQTLTTEVGKTGSYAAGQVHNDVRSDIVKADADMLCECLNDSLIKWLVDYNFPGVTGYPKMWIRTEEEQDLNTLADRDTKLQKMGVVFTQAYIEDKYGVPAPPAGAEVITPAAAGGSQGTDPSQGENPPAAPPAFSDPLIPILMMQEMMKERSDKKQE